MVNLVVPTLTCGARVSRVNLIGVDAACVPPAQSVTCALRVWMPSVLGVTTTDCTNRVLFLAWANESVVAGAPSSKTVTVLIA